MSTYKDSPSVKDRFIGWQNLEKFCWIISDHKSKWAVISVTTYDKEYTLYSISPGKSKQRNKSKNKNKNNK